MPNDVLTTTRSPIVDTATGKIRGATAGGVHVFKGVPYGASTEGANRFMAAQPPASWSGVRDAIEYRGHAPQSPNRAEKRPELATTLGPPDATQEGEDCLSLNLWTPGLDNAKRPVMVWLHGGAFAYGSGNRAVTAGENLARRGDVVVVSVNHRLNILGYLDLAERGGSRFAHSGNAGSLDLVAALHWVRDNIAQFGGDPGNVTIFGESGGGGKVSVLMAMPAAKGLFHKAVVQSGATIRVSTRERGAALVDVVLKELGTDCDGLQKIPSAKLLTAMAPASRAVGPSKWRLLDRYDFGPVADGTDLPHQPFDPAAPAMSGGIPLLIGGTREESGFFLADDDEVWHGRVTDDSLRRRVAAVAGAETDRVLAAYPDGAPGDRLIAALTGSNFWVRTVLLAERKSAQPAPVYVYSLDWRSPFQGGRLKAHHAMDLPFVFNTTDIPDTTKGAAGAVELAAIISEAWSSFARTGTPQTAALPTWPTYNPTDRATMLFNARCQVVKDPDREARMAWMTVVEAQGK